MDNGTQSKKGQELTNRAARIEAALRLQFSPAHLNVRDESALHAGHSGARPEGETHYRIQMTAAAFAGQSRIAQHRAVNAALKEEFDTGLHALALELSAPD